MKDVRQKIVVFSRPPPFVPVLNCRFSSKITIGVLTFWVFLLPPLLEKHDVLNGSPLYRLIVKNVFHDFVRSLANIFPSAKDQIPNCCQSPAFNPAHESNFDLNNIEIYLSLDLRGHSVTILDLLDSRQDIILKKSTENIYFFL